MLLDKGDIEGPFKTASERDGRWSPRMRMQAERLNEAYRLRSSFQAANSEDGAAWFDTKPHEWVDPAIAAQRQEAESAQAAAVSKSQADFEAQLGFS